MTREEAINELKNMAKFNYTLAPIEVFEMAIQALESIDEIRAEIIELRSKQNVGVLECLDIIDKYKAESEK